MDQTVFGAGISASCQPLCGVCGCTSTSWSMSGAARWWPGMWLRWSRLRSLPIWCSGPASRSATATPSGFDSNQCHQPTLILHADNGNAMCGATLESRLEKMGVLRSFSRPRVSNGNPTQNPCSVRSNTGLTTPGGPLSAKTRHASGWRCLSTGTTTGIGIGVQVRDAPSALE